MPNAVEELVTARVLVMDFCEVNSLILTLSLNLALTLTLTLTLL